MKKRITPSQAPEHGAWSDTRWSQVQMLAGSASEDRSAAWEWLIHAYGAPMERYAANVLRRMGATPGPGDAKDLLQSFFRVCLEKNWLTKADPNRGRFRPFVRTLLKRYALNRVRRDSAKMRKPEGAIQPLTEVQDDSFRDEQEAFDREWVGVAIASALDALRTEDDRYYAIVQDLLRGEGESSDDLHEVMGITKGYVAVLRFRARKRFTELIAESLAATVQDSQSFEDEWNALKPYLP